MSNLFKGKTGSWEIVIGLEVHAQVKSKSKLFSSSSTKFGSIPNSQVSLVDAAMPGMLPVINEYCIRQAVKTGLGLKAKINKYSVFDRKNYFYADLPQGYQISQYKFPIVGKGVVTVDLPDNNIKNIRIVRLHLEQDAGKSLHDQHPEKTFVDLNRSGVALMEIVTEPDIRSSEEAAIFILKLRSILRYLVTSEANMQDGSLRADLNVSVKKPNEVNCTRCEIKNMNSIKFIRQAINYEAKRQIEILENGKIVKQDTLLYDEERGKTRSMRNKEDAHDYRYFPDPDLLPLELNDNFILKIKNEIPELPDERKIKYIQKYNLSNYDASLLIEDREISDYFDSIIDIDKNFEKQSKLIVNWITSELFALLKKENINIRNCPISPKNLGDLIILINSGEISGKIAKDVFIEMFETKNSPQDIVKKRDLAQISDQAKIEVIVDKVINSNIDKINEYKKGKTKLFGYFIGEAMKESKGKANPKILNEVLSKKLLSN